MKKTEQLLEKLIEMKAQEIKQNEKKIEELQKRNDTITKETNVFHDMLMSIKIDRAEMQEAFDVLVTEVEEGKPKSEIFQQFATSFGLEFDFPFSEPDDTIPKPGNGSAVEHT